MNRASEAVDREESSVPEESRPLRVGRALSRAEGCESREERLWSRGWGCLVWPRGCAHVGVRCTHGCDVHTWPRVYAHVARRVCTHGQESVYTWPRGVCTRGRPGW